MKYIFIVQGEGRGHMTQAMSLYDILTSYGHEVSHVIVGKSKRRELPEFFIEHIKSSVTRLESPNFVIDKQHRSVDIFRTLILNLRMYKTFLRSISVIDKIVIREKPDAIINFYDFLSGLYFMLKRPKVKHIALAHQFLFNHTQFKFPKGRFYDKPSLLCGNRLASYRADKILALSFREMKNEPEKKLFVVPPLLRTKIKTQQSKQGKHFLVYMVNHGYSEHVIRFHKNHPNVPIHCFWDKKNTPKELKIDDTLTFHQLNDETFLQLMSSCKGYLTTAGFESVCEAMYLGKPVLMIPVEGHYEQACNALDATKAGAGTLSEIFDPEILLNYLSEYKNVDVEFKNWCRTTPQVLLQILT